MTIDTEVISLGGHAAFYIDGDALIDIHEHTLCHIYSGWLLRVQIRIPSGKTVRHKSRGMNYEITYAHRIVLSFVLYAVEFVFSL